MTIRTIESEADPRRAFPVMVQLRPHLTEDSFVERAMRQMGDGYQMAILEYDGVVARWPASAYRRPSSAASLSTSTTSLPMRPPDRRDTAGGCSIG